MEHEGTWYLCCNVRFRSNDAWGASFMNMFGLTHFNRALVADPLAARLGGRVELGRLNWQADSYHIYGKDQKDFAERFHARLSRTTFEDRVYAFWSDPIQEMWSEAEGAAKTKIGSYDARRGAS
jgi:thymidylate synthase